MPYIKQEKRKNFDRAIKELVQELEKDKDNVEGNLNYVFSKIIWKLNPKDYKEMNGIIGALESCKLEFYRAKVAEYEDKKIKENGGVLD